MSAKSAELMRAFGTPSSERSEFDLMTIYHHIHRLEALNGYKEQHIRALCRTIRFEMCEANTVLYKNDDPCTCWYILQSGSVFIQGSMFLPRSCFGKQIPGTKRRGSQCIALERSEMLVIDYPEQQHQSNNSMGGTAAGTSSASGTTAAITGNHPARGGASVGGGSSGGGGRHHHHHHRQHKSDSLNSARSSTLGSVTEIESSSTDSSPAHVAQMGGASGGDPGANNHTTSSPAGAISENKSTSTTTTSSSSAMRVGNDENLSRSHSSISKTTEDDELEEPDDEEDSISLRSESSIYMKDLVIDVVKKGVHERNADDLAILMEFTKSLKAFSNMTEPTRRALCKVMVFAWVENAHTTVLKDQELLDSWSVIINGQVTVKDMDSERTICMGESFGVEPTLQQQKHCGVMSTLCDDCQFLCVAQQDYYEVLNQGKENMDSFRDDSGQVILVKERRDEEGGSKSGSTVIRGSPEELLRHLLEDGSLDNTYADDYLLTYRAFHNEPLYILRRLLDYHDEPAYRQKVVRTILLWVNNHFSDFENNWKMIQLLEEFDEKLKKCGSKGEAKLFKIACSAKARPRKVHIVRECCDEELGFELWGGAAYECPVYISTIHTGSEAEAKGVKRGDQLIEVNGQNVEKLALEKAQTLIKKNTELRLLIKTSLFCFKERIEVTSEKKPLGQKKTGDRKGGKTKSTVMPDEVFLPKVSGKGAITRGRKAKKFMQKLNVLPTMIPLFNGQESADDSFLTGGGGMGGGNSHTKSSTMIDFSRHNRTISSSNPDLLDPTSTTGANSALQDGTAPHASDAPEDVIKVYRSDQSHRFIFVNRDTTAGEAVIAACREFSINTEVHNYSLYRVSVQQGNFVKCSKLPDAWVKLADISLGTRYYLKNSTSGANLLPDENIPDLVKEENFSFLDLNCLEVALYLTRSDYRKFQNTESYHFVNDLFAIENSDVKPLKDFEALVNREHFWIATMICSEPSCIQRAKIIKNVIKVAHSCKLLKNLNSAFALVSGLGYRAVSRMKQTWEKVPAKSIRVFDELQALMDPSRNMSKYRTLCNELIAQPPVIPYIPVVKKDLTFIHLGNDTKVDGLINFEKMRMIAREVRNICRLSAPDESQLIPSAIVASQTSERANQTTYQTLARRGRRSSFNNARQMYNDQINKRRVRQFMESISIEEDEEELMNMSKKVESLTPVTSSQTKRRATTAGGSGGLATDSPSRSSKTIGRSGSASSGSQPPSSANTGSSGGGNSATLPANNSGTGGGGGTRNNSEPQIAQIPTISLHPTRRKVPITSLPKFGATSPRALKKMVALSVEGHENDRKSGGGKKGRSNSTTNVSTIASTPQHNINPNRASSQREQRVTGGNHCVAHENSNRNNNRHSMPPSSDHHHHQHHVTGKTSARSSVSTSSGVSGSSPSASRPDSPLSWHGSHVSLATSNAPGSMSKPPLPNARHHYLHHLRASSSSSSDATMRSSSSNHESRSPIIMSSSSSSTSSGGRATSLLMSDHRVNTTASGGPAHMMILPDRRVMTYANHMTSSSSTPSLNLAASPAAANQHLHTSQSALINGSGHPGAHHHHHLHHHGNPPPQPPPPPPPQTAMIMMGVRTSSCDSGIISASSATESVTSSNRQSCDDADIFIRPHHHHHHQTAPPSEQHQEEEETVEQSFLFGSRGLRDAPLQTRKDPSCCSPPHFNNQQRTRPAPHQYPMMFTKKAVKGINEYLVCEQRHYKTHHHFTPHRSRRPHHQPPASFDPTSYGGIPFPTYTNGHHHHAVYDVTSGADVDNIEEQLLMMELEKQAPLRHQQQHPVTHLRHHRVPDPNSATVKRANYASKSSNGLDHYDQLVRSPTISPGRVKSEEWGVVDLDDRVTSWEQETMITSITKTKIKSPAHSQSISSDDHVIKMVDHVMMTSPPSTRRSLPSYNEAIHQKRSSPFNTSTTAASYHPSQLIAASSGEEQVSHV